MSSLGASSASLAKSNLASCHSTETSRPNPPVSPGTLWALSLLHTGSQASRLLPVSLLLASALTLTPFCLLLLVVLPHAPQPSPHFSLGSRKWRVSRFCHPHGQAGLLPRFEIPIYTDSQILTLFQKVPRSCALDIKCLLINLSSHQPHNPTACSTRNVNFLVVSKMFNSIENEQIVSHCGDILFVI